MNLLLYRYNYNGWKVILLDRIVSIVQQSHMICFSIGYETILLLFDFDSFTRFCGNRRTEYSYLCFQLNHFDPV
jgi:hypothetical protein